MLVNDLKNQKNQIFQNKYFLILIIKSGINIYLYFGNLIRFWICLISKNSINKKYSKQENKRIKSN